MRLRAFIILLALALLPVFSANSEAVVFGDTAYVYSGAYAAEPNLSVSVQYEALDAESLSVVPVAALDGAVFGIYAKGPDGFVPFPDPSDPSKPLRLSPGTKPAQAVLPVSVDLYIRQDAAPGGFLVDQEAAEYRLIRLPETLTFVNRKAGETGVRVQLTDTNGTPMAGIALTLEGAGKRYTLRTDEQGIALAYGVAPGAYTLHQDPGEGYTAQAETAIIISEHELLTVEIQNSRDGAIALRSLGIAVNRNGDTLLTPLARAFRVYTAAGEYLGELQAGEPLAVPASADGVAYTVRPEGSSTDGFSQDTDYTVLVYPGMTAECQTLARSEMGFFDFVHISAADGAPVAGGRFEVLDAQGELALSFEAGEDGRYASQNPLPAGQYTLRMARAAEGHQYTGAVAEMIIAPYLNEGRPVAQASIASEPVPAELLSPVVTMETQTLPSLYEADARITLAPVFLGGEALPVQDVALTLNPIELTGARMDGDLLTIAQRFRLDGAEAPDTLRVTGIISYTFSYAVAPEEMCGVCVEAPFEVVAATFVPPAESLQYAMSGHVRDERGEPMPGLSVTVESQSGVILDEVKTDPYGAYAFERLVGGAQVVVHAPQGYGARMDGTDAVVLPLRTVSGRVEVYGLTDASVTLTLADLPVQVLRGEGEFSFTGALRPDDRLEAVPGEGVLMRMEADKSGETLVRLYAPAVVSGVALDPDAVPVAGAGVTLVGDGQIITARTGADGSYRIEELFPGEYEVSFEAPSGYLLLDTQPRAFTLEAGEEAAEDIRMMRPASIEGTMTEEGKPLAGVTVTLHPTRQTAVTDAEGHFLFGDLLTGTYTVEPALAQGALVLEGPGGIALTQSGERASVAFSVVRPVNLSGRVWRDANDDGLYTPDEPGFAGAHVTLLSEANDALQTIETASDGRFAFEGLLPGTYRIGVSLPEGMMFSREAAGAQRLITGVEGREGVSAPFVLASGESATGLLCGAAVSGVVRGQVYLDVNASGTRDASETALEGVLVELLQGGRTLREARTDANGVYTMADLRAGDYTLRATLPEGYLFTLPLVDNHIATQEITKRGWRSEQTVDFGAQRTGAVQAFVWLDEDARGTYWSQQGLSGVSVTLLKVSGSSERAVGQTVTDADGEVHFDGLRPGAYRLQYGMPSGSWGFTTGVAESASGTSERFSVEADKTAAHAAGLTRLGEISGIVFADADYDGLRGAQETGIAAKVTLLDRAGVAVASVQTGADGAYRFAGLTAGQYAIRFELPEGYQFTQNRADAPSYNSDVPETKGTVAATGTLYLPMGETLLVDAGGYQAAYVSGVVWQDVRNDAVYTPSSLPIANIPVALLHGGEIYMQGVTDGQGSFAFGGLPPGQYAVEVTLPDGLRVVSGGALSFSLAMGERRTDVNTGAVYLGAARGRVLDGQTGKGIGGIAVTLMRSGEALGETQTDASGVYHFDGLMPGTVEVLTELPAGRVRAVEDVDTLEVVVPQRKTEQIEDIRLLPEAILEGTLWLDADADGVWGQDEEPLNGVTVWLAREGYGTPLEQKTVEDGQFRFDGLTPGVYSVRAVLPDGVYLWDEAAGKLITLDMGETATVALPVYTGATVRGTVYEDLNNDGARDDGEPGLAGVSVVALDGQGRLVAETETDASGAYHFSALPPTVQTVRITPPEGCLLGLAAPQEPLPLSMGDTLTDIDAAMVRAARVGDLVWLDMNGNGLQDTGEPGIPGITVTLWRIERGVRPQAVAETQTDANGRYRFDAVLPGLYQVSVDIGDLYVLTKMVTGLDQISSKLQAGTGPQAMTVPFTVHSGERLLIIDAGLLTPDMAEEMRISTGD